MKFEKYGPALKPSEVAKLFHLDSRTVIKYAQYIGGVEVFPGTWRFFENLIKEKIDACNNQQTWKTACGCYSSGQQNKTTKIISGRKQGFSESSCRMGKENKEGTSKLLQKKYGIDFD